MCDCWGSGRKQGSLSVSYPSLEELGLPVSSTGLTLTNEEKERSMKKEYSGRDVHRRSMFRLILARIWNAPFLSFRYFSNFNLCHNLSHVANSIPAKAFLKLYEYGKKIRN